MPSNFPEILTACIAVIAMVAVALAIVAGYRRAWVAANVKEWQAKAIAEFVAFGAAIGGTIATYTVADAKDKTHWIWPVLSGAMCAVSWKMLQYFVESIIKAVERVDRQKFERAKRESQLRTRLLVAFRSFVKRKADRTADIVRGRDHAPSLPDARRALTPGPHLRDILFQFAVFLQARCEQKLEKGLNVRVGVYVESGGVMIPVHAENANQPQADPFTSYRQHQERYRVSTADRPSHVVKCVRERQQILIVEDCKAAAAKGEFFFFSPEQEAYLQSIVLHFLGEVCDESGTMTRGVLAIDADQPRAFEESEREDLLLCLLEFGQRITFEMALRCLLEGGVS